MIVEAENEPDFQFLYPEHKDVREGSKILEPRQLGTAKVLPPGLGLATVRLISRLFELYLICGAVCRPVFSLRQEKETASPDQCRHLLGPGTGQICYSFTFL